MAGRSPGHPRPVVEAQLAGTAPGRDDGVRILPRRKAAPAGPPVLSAAQAVVQASQDKRLSFMLYCRRGMIMDHPLPLTATDVIDTLRAHRDTLERAGVTHLSLFGSVAWDEAGPES